MSTVSSRITAIARSMRATISSCSCCRMAELHAVPICYGTSPKERRPMAADDIDRYLDAANRSNTSRSYQGAVRHFEVEWGGFLPATPDSVARYLAHYADSLAINTLKQRLAALAKWHNEQGFADPTKAPIVRKVLKGIRTLHPTQEKQARPIQLEQLRTLVDWLDSRIADDGIGPTSLRYRRDKALVLLGFWRGFRGDELTRLCI